MSARLKRKAVTPLSKSRGRVFEPHNPHVFYILNVPLPFDPGSPQSIFALERPFLSVFVPSWPTLVFLKSCRYMKALANELGEVV